MNRKTGRLLWIVLIISIFISINAYAGGVENRINTILSQFPSGSYFTANGTGCGHSSDSTCSNCQLSSVLASRGIAFDSNKYLDGWTCYGFASYVFGTVFETRFDKAIGVVSSGEVSSNQGMYDAFSQAKMGDVKAGALCP